MMTRNEEIERFLSTSGWGHALRDPIPGDASFRHYERISAPDKGRAILMNAPPEVEDVRPFAAVQSYFESAGYAVPQLLSRDDEQGFLLLEDFGDWSFTRALYAKKAEETELYHAAIDVLAHVTLDGRKKYENHEVGLPAYDTKTLNREVRLLGEWFLPQLLGAERAEEAWAEFQILWRELLANTKIAYDVVVHRDYHADNLFWLPDGKELRSVGMIDFQDAVLGMPAYDLVSLLEDARRDVAPEVVASSFARFLDITGLDPQDFKQQYAFLGLQRNAKILGIFARLHRRDGKTHYLNYLPRVWQHFLHDMEHPSCSGFKAWKEKHIPFEMESKILQPKLLMKAVV